MSTRLATVVKEIRRLRDDMFEIMNDCEGDRDLVKAYKADGKAYDRIVELLEIGMIGKAQDFARDLDSLPRDRLPDVFWDLHR